MIDAVLELELLVVGLLVVWLCVRIASVPKNDPLQVDCFDYADAGV